MAIVKFSAIISSVTGKLSGNTFSSNRGVATLSTNQNRTRRTASNTIANRRKFSNLATKWRSLTTIQRNTWIQLNNSHVVQLPLKNNQVRTPFQLFQYINNFRLMIGQTLITTAPTGDFSVNYYYLNVTWSTANNAILFRYLIQPNSGQSMLWFFASSPQKQPRSKALNNYKYIGSRIISVSTDNTINDIYLSVYSSLPKVGEYVKFRVFAGRRLLSTPTGIFYFTILRTA